MARNDAVRAQIRVMMADGAGASEPDGLVDAVVDLVLEALGAVRLEANEVGVALRSRDHSNPSRDLAARRAAEVIERLEPLTSVAEAGERYRRAVRKGKGAKKARKRLFEALEAWSASRVASAE